MSASVQTTARSEERFVLIDALRAFAALWVVSHHWYFRNLIAEGATPFWAPIHAFFREGWLGVEVFFVLSGFVITHSIRGARVTPGYLGRFALRRSLRLDPPYWAAIVGTIVLNILSSAVTHERLAPTPNVGELAAHIFYLQGFFGIKNIVGVFWTLCYEIQFYLLLVVATGFAARIRHGRYIVFGALWLFSMLTALEWIPLSRAFAFSRWPLFFFGVLVYWTFIERSVSLWIAIALGALTLVPILAMGDRHWMLEVSVASATAIFIGVAAWKGFLSTLSMGAVAQFLGRISYSIYLLHMVVGTRAVHLVMRYYGYHLSVMQSVVAIAVGLVVTLSISYLNYRLIEKPAHGLSRRISMDPTKPLLRPMPALESTKDANAA